MNTVTQSQFFNLNPKANRPIEKTWHNNSHSDYTEKIEQLGNQFNYDNDKQYYWGSPEQSILYGTPIYQNASEQQKLALNHLFWLILYYGTASSETNTIFYNQITSGVFQHFDSCQTLCQELELETEQERQHIRAFHKVGRQTSQNLLGTKNLSKFLYCSFLGTDKNLFFDLKQILLNNLNYTQESEQKLASYLSKKMFDSQQQYYSLYFLEREEQSIPINIPNSGYSKRTFPSYVSRFVTLGYGSSPFLASYFYITRFFANVLIKIQEKKYLTYLKSFNKHKIPTPTNISRYHFLDESFHITVSQSICRDLYENLPNPDTTEIFVANLLQYNNQRVCDRVSGISTGISGNYFGREILFMGFVYKLLQSPIFGMSQQDALYWMEKSLCDEHEGMYVTLKDYQRLIESIQRLCSKLEYLWPVNRNCSLIRSKSLIENAVQTNRRTFKQFTKAIASH